MQRPLVLFKNRYAYASDINSKPAFKICNRDINKLPEAHQYAARLYIKSLFEMHQEQIFESYDTVITDLEAYEERMRLRASLSQVRDDTAPESTRINYMEKITKYWGPDVLQLLRQNRFQRESTEDFLKNVSSVAKKFPDYDRARRLVNSVIVQRLIDNRTHIQGRVEEANALDWAAVCKMSKNADTTRLDYAILSGLKLAYGDGDELVPAPITWAYTPLITRKRKKTNTEQESAQEEAFNTGKKGVSNKGKEGVRAEESRVRGCKRAKGEGAPSKGKYGSHLRGADASNAEEAEIRTTDKFREENHSTNLGRPGLRRSTRGKKDQEGYQLRSKVGHYGAGVRDNDYDGVM